MTGDINPLVFSGELDLGELPSVDVACFLNEDWEPDNDQPLLQTADGSALWLADNGIEKLITFVKEKQE